MTSVSSTLQSSPSQTGSELSELNRRPGRAASLSPPPPAASDTVALQSDSSAGAPPSDAAVAGAEEGGGGGDGSGGSGSERQPGVSRHHRSLSSRFSGLFSGGAGGGGAGAGAGGAAAGGAPTSWSSSLRRRSDPAGLETGGGALPRPGAAWQPGLATTGAARRRGRTTAQAAGTAGAVAAAMMTRVSRIRTKLEVGEVVDRGEGS